MGLLSRLFRNEPLTPAQVETGPKFSVDIPASFFGLTSYADPVSVAPRVSRTVALQVPAVKRCLDLTAGVSGRIPLLQLNSAGAVVASRLLTQPEAGIPRSITMIRTIADLLLDGVAWWMVTAFDWQGRPASVVRLDPRTVTVSQDAKVYRTLTGNTGTVYEWVPDSQMIRFDSPSEAILCAGARAIRTLLLLDSAAENSANGVPPQDYFTPTGGVDPAEDDDITSLLNDWTAARKTRRTAYVPAGLQYNSNPGFSPEQLQLIESRQHAVVEIARLFGVDAEELGVSTTSRTYFNSFDRRKQFVDFTLGLILAAIEDRLSMDDVTVRGNIVRADLDVLLRSDPQTRMAIAAQGVAQKILSVDEARLFFDTQLPEVGSEEAAIAEATTDPPVPAPGDPGGQGRASTTGVPA